MQLFRILILTFAATLIAGCSAIPILTGDQNAKVALVFDAPTSGKTLAGQTSSSGSRFLASDNFSATLTIQTTGALDQIYQFTATIDGTGKKIFSVAVEVSVGRHVFIVDTFDAQGNLLTHGQINGSVGSGNNTISIPMNTANTITPGQSLTLAANQVAYFSISSPTNVLFHIDGTGMTFWECAADGSFAASPAISDTFETQLLAGVAKIIRVCQGSTGGSLQTRENHWVKVANLTNTTSYPTITSAAGWEFAAGLGNTIYFATPSNISGQTQAIISFNTLTNVTSNLTKTGNDLIAAGYNSDLIGVNGKLYYFANSGTSYNPAADTAGWSSIATYTYAMERGEPGSAVVGTKIYYFGYRDKGDGNGPGKDFQIFDTATGVWSLSSANTNHATDWAAVAPFGSKLYVFGGSYVPNKLSVYDIPTNSWSELPDIPYTSLNTRPKALNCQNIIYFISYNNIYPFDPSNNTWGRPITNAVGTGSNFVVVGTTLYTIGWDSSNNGYAVSQFVP